MDYLSAFAEYFYANQDVVGNHIYGTKTSSGEKREGKSWTKREPLTISRYEQHLEGKQGLGLVPIFQGNRCCFAAIDVDVYNNKKLLKSIVMSIYKWNLPLIPFYSKSEGLHLYLFFKDEGIDLKGIPANDAMRFCHMFAKLFAIQTYEVFPKQGQLTESSFGNWINMPYYGGFKKERPVQSAIDGSNNRLTITEALELIGSKRMNRGGLEDYINTLPFHDGPPCLQKMAIQGGPGKGNGRNVYLFNASIYLKEKDHTTIDAALRDIDSRQDEPIGDENEIRQILNSVIKKEYHYECKKNPLCEYCDSETCSTKAFGVGKSGGSFMGVSTGILTILRGRGKSYEWEVFKEDRRAIIRFDSPKELQEQNNFIAAVLSELDFKASKVKAEKWDRILNTALGQSQERDVEFTEDNSLYGRITKQIVHWITTSISQDIADIEKGFVYVRDDKGDLLFRPDPLFRYLTITNRVAVTNAEFQGLLKKLPCSTTVIKIEERRSLRVRVARIVDVESLMGAPLRETEDVDWGDLDGQTEF